MEHFTTISGLCELDTNVDNPMDATNRTLTHLTEHTDMTDQTNPDRHSDGHTAGNSTGEESEDKRIEKQSKCPLLPPCRVCGDQATGFHYGATTCEACKGFFRRSLVRKKEFTCIKGTYDCDVMAPKKAPCPGCRFKRCMAAGMSKNGIKRGRYSLIRKTHHIMEVKGLRSTDLSPAPSKLITQSVTSSTLRHPISPSHDVTIPPSLSGALVPLAFPKNANVTEAVANEEFLKRKELIDILENLCREHCGFPQDILHNLEEMQEEYLNVKRDHNEYFGPWDLMDTTSFVDLYNSTGIDADYRVTYFSSRLKLSEELIYNLVAFAKNIPGFRDIVLADQMTLVKSVQFHWWFLCCYFGIVQKTQVYTSPFGDSMLKRELERFTGEEYGDMVFNMAESFRSLKLNETERALVIALCLFSSDFAIKDLQDTSPIDALHQEIGEALYFYLKSRKDSARFAHIISALTQLRSAHSIHIEGRNKAWKILEETKFAIPIPPLVLELWAGMIPAVAGEKVMKFLNNPNRIGIAAILLE